MVFEAILNEVEQLHNVSTRLEGWQSNIRQCQSAHNDRGKRSRYCDYIGSPGRD